MKSKSAVARVVLTVVFFCLPPGLASAKDLKILPMTQKEISACVKDGAPSGAPVISLEFDGTKLTVEYRLKDAGDGPGTVKFTGVRATDTVEWEASRDFNKQDALEPAIKTSLYKCIGPDHWQSDDFIAREKEARAASPEAVEERAGGDGGMFRVERPQRSPGPAAPAARKPDAKSKLVILGVIIATLAAFYIWRRLRTKGGE
jgi:hypothetical protein